MTVRLWRSGAQAQGTWTATLYGAQVAPGGEETRLDIYQPPAANEPPTARIEQAFDDRTVTVDGSASSDPDGSIVRYLWEFGDGATAEGATASHTYTEPGAYLVTLAVQDNRGRWNVASAPGVVEVE
jgi:PKD repeat protein